jgi:hypothetical protein
MRYSTEVIVHPIIIDYYMSENELRQVTSVVARKFVG